MKKLLTTLCVLALVVACLLVLPTRAEAATEGKYTYEVTNGQATITGFDYYYGDDKNVVIPATLGGYPVTAIGDSAFESKSSLESITIPEGVTTIGAGAFSWTYITSVTIPSTVRVIGDEAFYYCSNLTKVVIPNGVKTIGKQAFYNSGLTALTLGNGVQTIGEEAFYSCDNLTELVIPASVKTIGNYAFYYCANLTAVTVGGGNIGESAFASCENLTTLNLANGVTSISKNIIRGSEKVTTLVIPKTVKTISDYAFSYSSLQKVAIYGGNIGEGAFSSCESLATVGLANGVKSIGKMAFGYSTALASIKIPNSVTVLGEQAFIGCDGLTAAVIGSGVTTVSEKAFASCDKLASVTFGSGVKTIGKNAFYNCVALKAVTIPNNVKVIGDDAFSNCGGLKSVTIGQGVTTIGEGAFWACSALNKVTIGNGVKTIGDDAFLACYGLKTVQYYGSAASWKKITIGAFNSNLTDATRKYIPVATIVSELSNAAAPKGKAAKVTVKATGSGLKYTWYYALKGTSKWVKTSTTSATFTSGKMSSKLNGCRVRCVVTDKYGIAVTSNTAYLYMGNPATIKTQPKNIGVLNGKTAKTTIKATGDGLKYTWYYKDKGATAFKKASVKTASYSAKMSSKVNGRQIYCVVTDKYGISVKTKTVTLTMIITEQPQDTYAVKGGTAKVTVKGSGSGLKYTWYYANKGSSKFKKLSVTKSTYSVKMSASVNGRRVYCVVTDKYGNKAKSNVVTLKMIDAKKIVAGSYKSTQQISPSKTTKDKNLTVKVTSAGKATVKIPKGSWYNKGTFTYTVKYQKVANGVVYYKFSSSIETFTVEYAIAKDQLTIVVSNGYKMVFKGA